MSDDLRFGRIDRNQLLDTFLASFADYAVDMSGVTNEVKSLRAIKNNVDWDVSVGVFADSQMVAFTLIAVDSHADRPSAFDAATGVMPAFRGRRLAGRMLEHAVPQLVGRGVERMLLEVLESNAKAIRAYEGVGFEIQRTLRCLSVPLPELDASSGWAVDRCDREVVLQFEDELAFTPSWENSSGAVQRIPEPLVCLAVHREGAPVGVLAYAPALNWIMRVAVHPSHRRRGIARQLVAALASQGVAGPVKVLNVDARDDEALSFFAGIGAEPLVDQFEMERSIARSRR